MSSASVNNTHRIYNQNQELNPTGNISLTLDSKRHFVVLMLCVLLITKKPRNGTYAKNGIRNKKLKVIKVVNWNF